MKMNKNIKTSLNRSISYQDYKTLVELMVKTESTTGDSKTVELADYTKLNDRRMKRWDKTVKVSDIIATKIKQWDQPMTWLVLTESWCGDAAHIIPVLNKIAELNENVKLKLVLRDENNSLMNDFLTNGNRSIPKVIMIDEASSDVVATYGPRPSEATKMVEDYKQKHGKLTAEFKEELQYWYNKNKGQNILEDVTSLLVKENV
jgi:thiol-disulfide isomerase/thioredoxin